MGNLLPSLARRALPMLDMPKLGVGGNVDIGSILYAQTKPGPNYVPVDGGYIPFPTSPKFPFPSLPGGAAITRRTLNPVAFTGMCFGKGRYVSTDGNNPYWSDDGLNWTAGVTSTTIGRVVFVNGIFVAPSYNSVSTSADGKTWIQRWTTPSSYPTANMQSADYVAGSYVIKGTNQWTLTAAASFGVEPTGFSIAGYGQDGQTARSNAAGPKDGSFSATANYFSSQDYITYYMRIETTYNNGGVQAARSTDLTGQMTAENCMTYGNGRLMFIPYSGIVYTSLNAGVTFTQVGTLPFNPATAIGFGDGVFVAVAAGKIALSADGVTWTLVNPPPSDTNNLSSILFNDGQYRISGGNNAATAAIHYLLITSRLFKLTTASSMNDIAGKALLPWMRIG